MKRIAQFIRSVIPADPFQLIFLAGVVCLVVAHSLRWWPAELARASEMRANWLGELLRASGPLFVYFIIFSAMAGYFVCFWPGNHPVRRILFSVCAPALIGLGLMFSRIIYLAGPPRSVLESPGSALSHSLGWAKSILWTLPTGFQFTLVGLVLIGLFTSRMAFGISTLPLALTGKQASKLEDSEAWRRLQFIVFVLLGPFFLLLSIMGLGVPLIVLARAPAYLQSVWFGRLAPIIESLMAYGVLVWFVFRKEKQTIKQSIRWPGMTSLLLAGAFAVGIDLLMSMGQYLSERVQWAAHSFGRFGPPSLETYFSLPDPWLLLMLLAAFCEELIFRGLLQARFVERFGVYRGVCIVGIVWAAYHFFGDFSFARPTHLEVFEKLAFRIFMCVVLSFVLAWLTLRAGSVLPAAVAHGLYNVFNNSSLGPAFPGEAFVRIGLWTVLAYGLFRYWPVREIALVETVAEPPGSEGTV